MNVLKDLGKGDFGGAWKDLKHIPGNQERANSKTLNSFEFVAGLAITPAKPLRR
jgi:hypothetical protein